jgi:hypothetical protein
MALLGLLLLFSALCSAAPPPPPAHVRYLVLGAGPGGLQLGHYLASAGRDYAILEAQARPASFFARYPRWRQLISINKRHVGRNDSLDAAQRHDWNSLLAEPSHAVPGTPASSTDARRTVASAAPHLRFGSYSAAYYPHADDLLRYMDVYAAGDSNSSSSSGPGAARAAPLDIRYGVTVTRVSRAAPASHPDARFHLAAMHSSGAALAFTCAYLLLATGLQEAVPFPSRNGSAAVRAGLVHTYASAPAIPSAYTGKRVLLLGQGNAAFEFASHTLGEAAHVHIAGSPRRRLQLALETHYPGHVRAVHAGVLETYNLKSLDGLTSLAFERLTFAGDGAGGVAVALAPTTCTQDAHGRPTSRCTLRHSYDYVIACLGWRFDGALFDAAVRPALASNGKHPAATARYESVNVPGLFLVGTLAHAVDHKRASGGFIHGFRYTARALHRILEEEELARAAGAVGVGSLGGVGGGSGSGSGSGGAPFAPWPTTRVSTLRALTALLLRRLNNAAGIFQMFGYLADVFVLDALPAAGRRAGAPLPAGSPHAAMEAPWDFYDAGAAAAAAAGADPTGLAAAVAAHQAARPAPPPAQARSPPAEAASEAAINAALAGGLREEVPVGHAGAAARAWAAAEASGSGSSGGSGGSGGSAPAAEWLQLTLEFGPAPPAGQKDPFALDRTADATLAHPERSHFLHPVLRYFHGAAQGCSSAASANGTCAPLATLHLVEDFHIEWVLHTAHVLPLSRFLQHLGLQRARAAAGAAQAGSAPPSTLQPWAPPQRPHPFLAGLLTQFLSGCGGATALHWGGAVFAAGAEADGWWLKLSLEAEASLAGLRALALQAVDAAPGLPLSGAEAAHTGAVRARWAAFGSGSEGEGGEALPAEEAPLPPLPPLPLPAGSAEAAEAFGALTRRAQGLGVLVLDARSGACRVLAERLGLQLGGLRVYHAGGQPSGSTKGSALEVPHANLTAAAAVPHLAAIFRGLLKGA